jgi:GMP synthase (glutamine-hydrolysing)
LAQHETVIILDFGGQYAQLIARRLREMRVFSLLLPWNTAAEKIAEIHPRALILSGGPQSVTAPGAPTMDRKLLEAGIPTLGVCYGMQLMAHLLGGHVVPAVNREYGQVALRVQNPGLLMQDCPQETTVLMSHGDLVQEPPVGFTSLGSTADTPVAAMANEGKGLYAVQFHPEVVHTDCGREILRRFLFNVAGLHGDWEPGTLVDELTARVRAEVGGGYVIGAISGGVDSAVAAALVNRAIGNRLETIFVDHGLLRLNEADRVISSLEGLGVRVRRIDARERFMEALRGVTDPETKRRTIGNLFVRIFEQEARAANPPAQFLMQGTLYPDVIESGSPTAATIKSHHNVGGLPADMQLKLVEPLRLLFKDEVRALGRELGLPEAIVRRQPFPGPGLAVRIIGDVTTDRVATLQAADAIVNEEIINAGLDKDLWQWFAILPGVRSVGVMGDGRTYQELVAIRAVRSEDGMTATWAKLSLDVLEIISRRITAEVQGINRVVYDITSKPPSTIEWE